MHLRIFTALFCFSTLASGFIPDDCGTDLGSFDNVTISGCDDSDNPCILRKGQNATIEIDFSTNEDASDLLAVVHGTVLILPVPFKLPQPDACKDTNSGISCPLKKGTSYRYKTTLPINEDYPSVSVTIKWELRDQNGKDIVCLELPARIR